MALIDDVKVSLRISTTLLNDEVNDLILSAKSDLILSGVMQGRVLESDPLIKRAIITYCKANFGLGNEDSEKYQSSYSSLKNHLCLSAEYNSTEV